MGTTSRRDFQTEARINIQPNIPPSYVAYELRYNDPITRQSYRQAWYWRWNGVRDGAFADSFANVPSFDTDKLIAYLRNLNVGWDD